jgi:ribose 5-phosphate isomerase B
MGGRSVPHTTCPRNRNGVTSIATKSRSTLSVGSDHAGFLLKEYLVPRLGTEGYEVLDRGTSSTDPVDYPPICEAVGLDVADGTAERGIVIGGTGGGEMIAANKVPGVRAVVCTDVFSAKMARVHDDANVLALAARMTAPEHAYEIVRAWLTEAFAGGRYQRRLDQIAEIESRAGRTRVEVSP